MGRDISKTKAKKDRMEYPIAYLITFTTYGTWLHGDKRGSVDKEHNRYGDAFIAAKSALKTEERIDLKNPPVKLSSIQRKKVLKAILEVCKFRGWFAYSVHVRSNHVHVVVSANTRPEKAMVDFKRYATRILKGTGGTNKIRKYWTRHGSTRYIWTRRRLSAVIAYVKEGQGKPMAVGTMQNKQSPEC